MGIQIITTPAGEDMIVMPRSEYEALVRAGEEAFEDGADVAAYDAALAANGASEILPHSVSADILAGKGRLRAFREWRSLSRTQLAEGSQLSEEQVAALEEGRTLISREAAARLAPALSIPFAWLAD